MGLHLLQELSLLLLKVRISGAPVSLAFCRFRFSFGPCFLFGIRPPVPETRPVSLSGLLC